MQYDAEDEQAVEQANEIILEQNKDTFIYMIGVITKLFECGIVKDYNGYCLIRFICETIQMEGTLYVFSYRQIAQQLHFN